MDDKSATYWNDYKLIIQDCLNDKNFLIVLCHLTYPQNFQE